MKNRKGVLLFLIMSFCLSACSKEVSNEYKKVEEIESVDSEMSLVDEEANVQENNSTQEKIIKNGEIIFTTEYTIENYCQNCFIISKNDGLLYGVLNLQGEEILPIKYDEISFLNEESVIEGEDENLYIQTRYENEYTVVNSKGEEILKQEVSCVDYALGQRTDEHAFFKQTDKEQGKINLYKENGDLFSQIEIANSTEKSTVINWISPKSYLRTDMTIDKNSSITTIIYDKVSLCKIDNQVIKQWEGMGEHYLDDYTYDEKCVAYLASNNGEEYLKCHINDEGEVEEESELTREDAEGEIRFAISEKMTTNGTEEYYLGEDKSIKLYQSNGTWKLENQNNQPVYDDRYYQCMKKEKSFFLVDEDNRVCLIDYNGVKIVDYGWLELYEDELYFDGEEVTSDKFFETGNSACFIKIDNDVSKVYYFSEEGI